MDKIWLVSLITLKEGIRNRALQGIFFIALLLCGVYLTIIPLFAFDTGKVLVDLGFASMTLAGLAVVIFLGISLLTTDIHQRTVCMVLCRPVSRPQYVIGKYLGLAFTTLISILIIACLAVLSGWLGATYIPEMSPPRNFSWGILAAGIFLNYLSLLIIMAAAFLFTVITTNAYLSMLLTFCVYLIGHSLETVVRVIISGGSIQVGNTHLQVLKLLTWVFPNLRAFDIKTSIGYGLPLSIPYTCWTAVYGIFYIGILMFLTIKLFNLQEIK